jgi:hypothetical protein
MKVSLVKSKLLAFAVVE